MALIKIEKNAQGVPTGEYTNVAGGTLYADVGVGTILPFGGTSDKIPTGFLLCDGAEVLKTDYVELYAVIGDAFGTASVNTKFVLPDLREATTKGAGETGKTVGAHVKSGGLAVGEFLDDRVQEHSHTFGSADNQVGLSDYSAYYKGTALSTGTGNKFNTGSNSGRTGATTEVKSVGVNYLIKAKQVALPADLESAVEDAVEEENKWEECSGNEIHASALNTDTTGTFTFTKAKISEICIITACGNLYMPTFANSSQTLNFFSSGNYKGQMNVTFGISSTNKTLTVTIKGLEIGEMDSVGGRISVTKVYVK